jgi:capsular polysaccharide biosynthesis protein
MTPKPRTPHPTLSDVALALATRRSEPTSTVKISDANAKGHVQIDVAVSDPDPKQAAKIAGDLYDVLRAKYPRAAE